MNRGQWLKAVFALLLLGGAGLQLSATTWYVRPDGGTRYSSEVPNGQCDGLTDAAYPGSGKNKHCAFNDYRYLYQDGSYANGTKFPAWGWVIKGGDTVIIRGSIGTKAAYRVGAAPPSQKSYCDPKNVCWGLAGDPADSFNPPIPAGTASQHTRILGENYAACTDQKARTQLYGGTGLYYVLDLRNTSYVDVQCLDITDFSGCSRTAANCSGANADFATNGIRLSNKSTDITLRDVRVHGLAYSGIGGPPGTGFVATDLAILGNGGAGWNADPGDGTTGVGTMLVQGFDISWNGCAEEYPIVDAVPYGNCRDDSTGGYGDGFGTTTAPSPAPGWQVHFDNGIASYNTQDGLDALHISGPGSTLTITRVLAFGNEGQQLKGGGAIATLQNNLIVGNCAAIQATMPGRPTPTGDSLGDVCRAANTAVAIGVTPGDPATYQNNTMISNGAVGVEVDYSTPDHGPTNMLHYDNNVFIGHINPGRGERPSAIYTDPKILTNPGASWTHNATYGAKGSCPEPGEHNAICKDPGLVDETFHAYGYGNMAPKPGAAVIGAGAAIPDIKVDFNGTNRSSSPSVGALESSGKVSGASPPTASNEPASSGKPQASVEVKVLSGAVAVAVLWAGMRYLRGRSTGA
ncbi:hypothetical protein GCM10011507_29870 [Edaphobacter acidisoli]|uniref:Right handed beta helix domain-containing protein n=1 Tax=Edaphobacter acidisoli TaxID=2040573 RepID=A0A916RYF3_9BACT|nr:hypothetical protein [Edaphobacter acidisoli]GGA76500.1 hypothetical protein GCM10011507_29870 [Edaphobacter acidisoli]